MMLRSYRSELYKLRKRPATWVVFGVWLVLMLVFTYLFPYLSYRSGKSGADAIKLPNLLPAALPTQGLLGYAVWGGSLIVVLGALTLGSEYGWGTLKTMLSNGPGRLTVFCAQVAAMFTSLAGLVVVAFVCSALASVVIAASTGASIAGPAAFALALSMAVAWLILCMWCLFGVVLAIVIRGTALSVGLGLVWVLAVENIVRATASSVPVIAGIEKALPGVNAGSLVAALGTPAAGSGGDGVASVVGGGQAAIVVALYLLLFGAVGALLLRRRDVV
ncbi:MAG: ABC transporter permease [Candidatus Dormiibacterota bacterium]